MSGLGRPRREDVPPASTMPVITGPRYCGGLEVRPLSRIAARETPNLPHHASTPHMGGWLGSGGPPAELPRRVDRVFVAPWVATVAGAENSQRDPVVRVAQVGVDRVDVGDDRRRVGLDLLDVVKYNCG